VQIFCQKTDGISWYKIEHLWGLIDSQGQLVTDAQYGLGWPFQNGYARAGVYPGIGIINTSGTVIVPPGYLDIRDFSEGLAEVQISSR